MSELRRSALRVQAALDARGLDLEVMELPQATRTAKAAAEAVGCSIAQIAKSILFRGERSGDGVLVVASGINRVDEGIVASRVGEPVAMATPEFVREATGYVIGGVPPCGHAHKLRTFIDIDLMDLGELWAAAGTPHSLFRLTPDDLRVLTDGEVTAIASVPGSIER